MPRMQVYLPDDLYTALKSRGLPASELLQRAVRGELKRLELLAETDRYMTELTAAVGAPTAKDVAWADGVASRVARRPRRKAG